ncbi:MAG: hypothetical protein H6810_10820 [Phycisphaeraceae bacterium]|nr:MAG: hypothetical protein H6810_10820 [Phycisphaeraceae bacterium]
MKNLSRLSAPALAAMVLAAAGCQTASHESARSSALLGVEPAAAQPVLEGGEVYTDPHPLPADREIADLTRPGAVARGVAPVQIIDTRVFSPQIAPRPLDAGGGSVEIHLPPHEELEHEIRPHADASGLRAGTTRPGFAIDPGNITQFTALDSTGWSPPDPTLAVGPNHVVSTVNMTIGWYLKDGTQQFQQILGSPGNPGFFEPVGAGDFTFDPKCFYDHYAQRFVVLALEVYNTTAYITIAVSDDSDPNGTWYKYRTDAVINVSGNTYWWDYPGFGYDQEGYYITGNLFGLNNGGFAGAGFRVFTKADMLVGAPVHYSTLREANAGSVQAAQHFGSNPAAYFVQTNGGNSMQVFAMRNPITSPTISQQSVTVPGFSSIAYAPVSGGGSLWIVDERTFSVHWRNGKLFAAHHVSVGGVAKPRWYEFNTGNWPVSGSVSLTQSGNADPGAGIHGFFPAIYSNDSGAVAMVYGTSSSSRTVGMVVTGRLPSDPAGTMAEPTTVRQSPLGGSDGRWGDYFDLAVDPNDGRTFWAIGETQESFGWDTRIASFTLEQPCPADLTGDGVLDLQDVNAFVLAFVGGNSAADLAEPFGVLDLADVQAFIAGFIAGCP